MLPLEGDDPATDAHHRGWRFPLTRREVVRRTRACPLRETSRWATPDLLPLMREGFATPILVVITADKLLCVSYWIDFLPKDHFVVFTFYLTYLGFDFGLFILFLAFGFCFRDF